MQLGGRALPIRAKLRYDHGSDRLWFGMGQIKHGIFSSSVRTQPNGCLGFNMIFYAYFWVGFLVKDFILCSTQFFIGRKF